ncbi:WD40 repeat domain-containing protein [Nocardia sp. NPDC058658]|uniref:WD40 repeat domain-containing protein n=1 Tax=Nocardia sp. NPDC058658 TaxID=3346580 RepID=UPI0036481F59
MVAGESQTPRAEFAARLSELFVVAKNPGLERIAAAANALAKLALGKNAPDLVTYQKIHAWRSGINLPKSFEQMRFVVLALQAHASKNNIRPAHHLVDLAAWEDLWETARKQPTVDTTCPYPGLRAYRREDAARFFGRKDDTTALVTHINSTLESVDAAGLVVVIGASGVGKSSLLSAGVVPALCDGAEPTWTIATMTPGAKPSTAMTEVLGESPDTWSDGGHGLLIVDQFEELFTACADERQRIEFIDALAALATPRRARRVVVVVAIRADFYAQCLEYPILGDALKRRVTVLDPMRLAELREAIEQPAKSAGLKLEPGLVELAITELCSTARHHDRRTYDPGALPLLSHVLAMTWEHKAKNLLTAAGYRKAGGVGGAIEATAERAWRELDEAGCAVIARDLLLDLVHLGPDGQVSRRRAERSALLETAADPDATVAVLEKLSAARLITIDRNQVFLTHEVVLTAWSKLRDWITEDRVELLHRQQLETDAQHWVSTERDPELLYRGNRLASATDISGATSSTALEFLADSRAARARAQRLRRMLLSSAALLAVAVLVLVGTAVFQTRQNASNRANAELAAVLAASESTRNSDPTMSALLDVVAHEMNPANQDVQARLLAGQNLPLATPTEGHDAAVTQLISAGRGVVVSAGGDGRVRWWDSSRPDGLKPVRTPLQIPAPVNSIALDRAGSRLVTASKAGVQVFDVSDPGTTTLRATLTTDDKVEQVALSADGAAVVAVSGGATVTSWPLGADGQPGPSQILDAGKDIRHVAFHPRRNWLIIASAQTIGWWVMESSGVPRPRQPVRLPASFPRSIAFSPDGATLAIGSGEETEYLDGSTDATVTLFDTSAAAEPIQIGEPIVAAQRSEAIALAFAPDGTTLAVTDLGQVTTWNVADRENPVLTGQPLLASNAACRRTGPYGANCNNRTTSMAFGTDDHTLVAGAAQGLLRRWSLAPSVVSGRRQWEWFADGSNTDRVLVSGAGGTVRLLDLADPGFGRELVDLGQGSTPPYVFSSSISMDGELALLPTDGGKTVRVFDISNPALPQRRADIENATIGAFLRGRLVIATSVPGPQWTFKIWDITDPHSNVPVSADKQLAVAPEPDDRPFYNGGIGMAMSQTGRWMVTNTPKTLSDNPHEPYLLRMWDLADPADPKVIHTMEPTELDTSFSSMRFTPDDRYLVTLTADHLQVWENDSGTLRAIGKPVPTAGLNLINIDISKDGKWIVTGAADSAVQLWDFTDPSKPRRFGQSITPPGPTPWGVLFTPRGDELLGLGNGEMRRWNLDPDAAVERVCRVGRGVLTDTTWRALLPGVPPRPFCQSSGQEN